MNSEFSLKEHIEKGYLCEWCINYSFEHEKKVAVVSGNVRAVIENSSRTKRGVLTPRAKVADSLALSVEKLKRLKFTGN